MAFAAAQMSYLVDLGMRPDADDSAAEEFSRQLTPFEEAEFERIALESDDVDTEEADDIERADDPTDADDVQRRQAPAAQTPAAPTPPAGETTADIVQRTIAAEREARQARLDFIRAESEGISADLVQRAMAEDWDQERTSREFLRSIRTRPAAVAGGTDSRAAAGHSRDSVTGVTLQDLQAGLLVREGFDLDDQMFQRREARAVLGRTNVQAGWLTQSQNENTPANIRRAFDEGHHHASHSLVDICRMSLQASGRQVPHDTDDMIRRALTTTSLTAIFSTSVNMQIIQAYLGVEDTTEGWTSSTDTNDFKTMERARMTKASGMKKLARGGTPNPIEFDDEIESYKLARYAGKFEISEEDIIDDRFGGMSSHTPRELGEMAAELRANLVFAIMLANKVMRDGTALFHADHGNLLANALALTGLDAAKVAMRTQTENGRNIRNAMRYLIVPESLDFRARQLINSSELRNPAATEGEGTANPMQNRFQIVSDPRLDNGLVDPETGDEHAGSATAWYGAAAAGSNSIEVAYRTGTGRAPRMSTYMLPGDRYGMGWKCDLDIAAKAIDWRAMLKSVPA